MKSTNGRMIGKCVKKAITPVSLMCRFRGGGRGALNRLLGTAKRYELISTTQEADFQHLPGIMNQYTMTAR